MRNYTVCIITAEVEDNNWEAHYDFLDDIPGSSLVENPSAPQLTFDIDAKDWNGAQIFTLGLADLIGITIISFQKLEERPSKGSPAAPHIEMVDEWVSNSPSRKRELCA